MYGGEMNWERFWYEEESQGVPWTRGHGKGGGKRGGDDQPIWDI